MFIFRCNTAGLFKTGWQGLLRLFKWCSATPPCVEGCTEPFKPTRKVLPALTLSPRNVTLYARTPGHTYAPPPWRCRRRPHCNRRPLPAAPSAASPGLASLSTHPGAALGGLVTHGSAGGIRRQRHLVVGLVGGGGVGVEATDTSHHPRFSM